MGGKLDYNITTKPLFKRKCLRICFHFVAKLLFFASLFGGANIFSLIKKKTLLLTQNLRNVSAIYHLKAIVAAIKMF